MIGENDSGKTAIVDAIRYVLRTQSGEFIQFEDKDFYQDSDGNRKDEFKIESYNLDRQHIHKSSRLFMNRFECSSSITFAGQPLRSSAGTFEQSIRLG